jgi:hypothetical protein
MKTIKTIADLLPKQTGKMRYFDDCLTTEWVKAMTQDMEQRLRAEGWVPPEERGLPASIAPQVAQDDLAHA